MPQRQAQKLAVELLAEDSCDVVADTDLQRPAPALEQGEALRKLAAQYRDGVVNLLFADPGGPRR